MSTDFRKVRSEAVKIWKDNYKFLTTNGVEPHNRLGGNDYNTVEIPASELNTLYQQAGGQSEANIAFWMTTDISTHGCIPSIIVTNTATVSDVHIHPNPPEPFTGLGYYQGSTHDASYLNTYVNNWKNFCMIESQPGFYENDYVFMRFFAYKWDHILTITNNLIDKLKIEIIAHTIGADNAHFETHTKDPNGEYEGWIALDLLLTNGNVGGPVGGATHYDFVRPCPKMCPNQP